MYLTKVKIFASSNVKDLEAAMNRFFKQTKILSGYEVEYTMACDGQLNGGTIYSAIVTYLVKD